MKLRNIAIIAHVDHGKTTLVDRLLQQSGSFRENQRVAERALDSNDLERERGITILSKVTSILWQDIRINIVDTPGHADFGGEVERILNMVDGALVLVDAAEGPLPQTKFVVTKALKVGLRPIVVINKVDRPDARPTEVANEVFDLFAALDASEEQLDFPILYGSAKQGWMASDASGPKDQGMAPLFDLVVRHVAQPAVEEGPFRMLGTILESNPYLGRIVTGRISSGSVTPNQMIKVLDRNGVLVEEGRVTKVLAFRGLERTPIDEAFAGDIVSIAGLPDATVSHTLCATEVTEPLPAQPIDPPTLAMTFRINDSPLAGTEGDKVQSRVIRERLLREAEGNVALRISESTERTPWRSPDAASCNSASSSKPCGAKVSSFPYRARRSCFSTAPRATCSNPSRKSSSMSTSSIPAWSCRSSPNAKASWWRCARRAAGACDSNFYAPTRGLIGYHGELLTDTRGTAVMNRLFHAYGPHRGDIPGGATAC